MERFKDFYSRFISEKSDERKGRGGNNAHSVDTKLPSYHGYDCRYFPISEEFSYIRGDTIGRKGYFEGKGIEINGTKQRCIELTNRDTGEVGYLSYTTFDRNKSENGKFRPVPKDSVKIEPDKIEEEKSLTRHGENFKKGIDREISYETEDGEKVSFTYVEGSGDFRTAKYRIDGYSLEVSLRYVNQARRKRYPLKLVLKHARKTSVSYMNFMEHLKKNGFGDVLELKFNGVPYEFIRIPGTSQRYSYNTKTKEFMAVNASVIRELLRKGRSETGDYEVDDEFMDRLMFPNTKRRMDMDSMKKAVEKEKKRIKNWEMKEQKIA